MFSKIVPAAVVALTALAATGSAFAHDAIVPREGFDTALATVEARSSNQTHAQTQAQAQQAVKVSGTHNPSVFSDAYPGVSSSNYTWWKDR